MAWGKLEDLRDRYEKIRLALRQTFDCTSEPEDEKGFEFHRSESLEYSDIGRAKAAERKVTGNRRLPLYSAKAAADRTILPHPNPEAQIDAIIESHIDRKIQPSEAAESHMSNDDDQFSSSRISSGRVSNIPSEPSQDTDRNEYRDANGRRKKIEKGKDVHMEQLQQVDIDGLIPHSKPSTSISKLQTRCVRKGNLSSSSSGDEKFRSSTPQSKRSMLQTTEHFDHLDTVKPARKSLLDHFDDEKPGGSGVEEKSTRTPLSLRRVVEAEAMLKPSLAELRRQLGVRDHQAQLKDS
ncbi:MAG: hypothetical protein M1825_004353 [Sarcosagium campestre]|nr:MAG: hypothetical protein M1825_004353 [Sarcosagium campestre]